MMRWPWDREQTETTDTIIERARIQREKAQIVIEFFLPEIDPNEALSAEVKITRSMKERAAWTA